MDFLAAFAGKKPSQALPRQLSRRESQAVKFVAEVLSVKKKFPAVILPLPLGEVSPQVTERVHAVRNSPSHLALLDASPLGDGAFGIEINLPAKVQSLRARQRLPPRGSWQNRQALTERASQLK